MAPTLVPRTTLTDTGLQIRYVDDIMTNVSPRDTALTNALKVGKPATNTKVEWFEDVLLSVTSTLNGSVSSTSATTITVASGDGPNFQYGSVLQIDSELVWVNADPVADTLSVTRGFAGTTAATHSNSATVTLVGTAFQQNVDAPRTGTTVKTSYYNQVQLFVKSIQVSSLQMNTLLYAQDANDYDYETAKLMKQAKIECNLAYFYGQRNDWSSSSPGALGGLNYWITSGNGSTVNDLSSAAITQYDIERTVRGIYDTVGQSNMGDLTIVCNSFVKQKINSFYGGLAYAGTTVASNYRENLTPGKNSTVGIVVERVHTDFGDINIMLDKFCPASSAFFLSMDNIKIVPFKDHQWYIQELPTQGPFKKGMLVGAYTLQVRAAKTHGLLKNISTSS